MSSSKKVEKDPPTAPKLKDFVSLFEISRNVKSDNTKSTVIEINGSFSFPYLKNTKIKEIRTEFSRN